MSSSPSDPQGDNGPWGIDASTGPDELEAPPVLRASRFPRWALVLFGVLPFPLVPPLRLDDYSRDANADVMPSMNPASKRSTVTATYSKAGNNAFVLLMSRPETDGKKFMADMGMNAVVPTDDGWCGTSVDSTREGCAVLRDDTALLVVDLSGMTRTDLIQQAHGFGTALAGQ